MPHRAKLSFIIFFSLAALVFLTAFVRFLKKPEELNILDTFYGEKPALEIFNSDPVRGATTAKITIVEFADFACEHCKESAAIMRQLLLDYPNNVRIVWKDLPATTYPEDSQPLHVAAQCANRQGRFWEYHDELFANQSTGVTQNEFITLAKKIGLDTFAFEECLTGNETIPVIIERNRLMAQELGVDGVPYFVVNETKQLSGVLSITRWHEEIDDLLKK